MKNKNYFIVILLTISFCFTYIMMFFFVPMINKSAPSYGKTPMTHNIKDVYVYKTSSSGSEIFAELFKDLVFFDKLKKIDSQTSTVSYEIDNEKDFKTMVVYNATAAFALIDGLEKITFINRNTKYEINRKTLVDQYEYFTNILYSAHWQQDVMIPVASDELDSRFAAITQ